MITNGNRKEEENGFIYNKDAGTYQCSAGFLADSINIVKDKRNGRNIRYSYNFSKSKCGDCPYREKCHPRKGRSVGNGLYETKIQGACVIFVTNLKRITTLMNENKKK